MAEKWSQVVGRQVPAPIHHYPFLGVSQRWACSCSLDISETWHGQNQLVENAHVLYVPCSCVDNYAQHWSISYVHGVPMFLPKDICNEIIVFLPLSAKLVTFITYQYHGTYVCGVQGYLSSDRSLHLNRSPSPGHSSERPSKKIGGIS